MEPSALQSFIDTYTSAGFPRIQLKWNGEKGHAFADAHGQFRHEVCEVVMPQLTTVPIELVRDLYAEMGRISAYTYCIDNRFHLLADELLKRGGPAYLLDYLKGAAHSMDAGMSSARLTLTQGEAQALLDHFDHLSTTVRDPALKDLWGDLFRQRFVNYANR